LFVIYGWDPEETENVIEHPKELNKGGETLAN
jgi:hypothetical protein